MNDIKIIDYYDGRYVKYVVKFQPAKSSSLHHSSSDKVQLPLLRSLGAFFSIIDIFFYKEHTLIKSQTLKYLANNLANIFLVF